MATSRPRAFPTQGSSSPRPDRAGYTLIELMVVVVIVGILSAVAIPAFRNYFMRARTVEGYNFLGEIHLRQEGYRSEFARYANIPEWSPATFAAPGAVQAFDATIGGWRQLGSMPDSLVRFQYQVLAGDPGTGTGVPGYVATDYWFVSHAQADLNGNGVIMVLEGYAATSRVYPAYGAIGGPYLMGGWE